MVRIAGHPASSIYVRPPFIKTPQRNVPLWAREIVDKVRIFRGRRDDEGEREG